MEREIVISYRLRNVIEPSADIPLLHQSILEDLAHDKIIQMLENGFTSGEFIEDIEDTNVKTTIEYKGWWERTFKIIKQ